MSREILLWYIRTTNAQTNLRTGSLIGAFVSRKCIWKKNQKYSQSFKQFGFVGPVLGPHCLQTKNDREDAPIHPLMEISGIAHERHTRIKTAGPGALTIAVFLFNDPPTVKVIWRRNHSFKSHPKEWWRKGKFWCVFLIILHVCVWRGEGWSSDFFYFLKFQGVQHMLSRGVKPFPSCKAIELVICTGPLSPL